MWLASVNFLHFAAMLFVVCTAILMIVSYATPAPAAERVVGLTYRSGDVAPAGEELPKDRSVNIIASVVLALIIGALWIIFR